MAKGKRRTREEMLAAGVDPMIKQIPYRVHQNDHRAMMKQLYEDGLKFQQVVDAAIQAYIKGDRQMLAVIREYRYDNRLTNGKRSYSFSQRERREILDTLEDLESKTLGDDDEFEEDEELEGRLTGNARKRERI